MEHAYLVSSEMAGDDMHECLEQQQQQQQQQQVLPRAHG
jgi:hypothetical protein